MKFEIRNSKSEVLEGRGAGKVGILFSLYPSRRGLDRSLFGFRISDFGFEFHLR